MSRVSPQVLALLWLRLAVFLWSGTLAFGTPPKLIVRPQGTNQLQLTASSLRTNATYMVMTRPNSPDAHWLGLTGILTTSNTSATALYNLSDASQAKGLQGLTIHNLARWAFAIGSGEDSDGSGLPDVYKELVMRVDPYSQTDPYADPDGDGWSNLQEMQNGTDPLRFDQPASPQNLNVRRYTNGTVIVTWSCWTPAESFIIERAERTLQRSTNVGPFILQPPSPLNKTNLNQYLAKQRQFQQRYGPAFNQRYNPTYVTGPFQVVARMLSKPGQHDYTYTETNTANTPFNEPVYQIKAHYAVPSRARLDRVNTQSIRQTIAPVTARPTTNGYDLTVTRPIPHACYLLLVRDSVDSQWRASGYFMTGSNREPSHIQVDKKGMMHGGQSPIAMPEAHFLSDVVAPEFTAGWGEDSDGDGLPDIYEVLVTQTDPTSSDTGGTGILDGYKELTSDGWSNLEKFRRRADPSRTAVPPPTLELRHPMAAEMMQALIPKSDLACEVQLAVRTNAAGAFQPIERVPWLLPKLLNFRQPGSPVGFDVQVTWRFADPKVNHRSGAGFPGEPSWYATLAPLIERVNLQLLTAFKARIENNPPVTWKEVSNQNVTIMRDYRGGEMDKGLAMAEMMLLADNTAQDFFGKVVDQHGQPVVDATVTATATREAGRDGPVTAQTDSRGLFQILGLRGRSVSISVEKRGFTIQGHGVGLRNANGPETSATNRAIFTMWKLKGPEPMIHDRKNYQFKSDSRPYTVDLHTKKMSEGTNEPGDITIQFQRPTAIKRGEHFEWSFALTAIGGGVIEVTNDDYLNEAPAKGFGPAFALKMSPSDPAWRAYADKTFYLKSRKGQAYGHIQLKIYPESRGGSSLEIESYVNPSGSRNLEFDPAKQTEYTPKTESPVPAPVVPPPKASHLSSTNRQGQIVSWGSMVLPFVSPRTRFTAVAAGGEHSLALTSEGTVVGWGRNLSGEATVPGELSNVVAIAAGGRSHSGFSVALKRDGRVIAWGDNHIFQTAVPAGLSNVVAITAGTDHSLALKKDGTIVGWEINHDGRSRSPDGGSNFVAVAAGAEHSVALRNDGTVIAWGRNQWGQTNVPPGLSNVVSICSGSYFSLALRSDGSVVSWGSPAIPKDLTNVAAIAAGPWNAMAMKRNGTLSVWGRDIFSPTVVPAGLSNVLFFAGGGSDHGGHCLAIKADGTILGWGNNNYGQSLSPGGITDVVSVAAGQDHYLAVRADGSLIGWGGDEHQGNGQAWVPATLGAVSSAVGGPDHSFAVRDDGTIASWGFDSSRRSTLPGDLTNVSAVATGPTHSLALRANGTVLGWGAAPLSSVPVSLSNVIAIAVASQHSLALRNDGTVVEWGASGVVTNSTSGGLSNVVAIAAGSGDYDLALKSDGAVIAWGSNTAGKTNIPPGLSNVTAIAAGGDHSLALRKDGTLIAWGANNAGQTSVPPGLSNVITIAAGAMSSVSIVAQPPESAPRVPGFSRRWIFWATICGASIIALLFLLRRRGLPNVTTH